MALWFTYFVDAKIGFKLTYSSKKIPPFVGAILCGRPNKKSRPI